MGLLLTYFPLVINRGFMLINVYHLNTVVFYLLPACFTFEALTGDYLFNPKGGENFSRDEGTAYLFIERFHFICSIPLSYRSFGVDGRDIG